MISNKQLAELEAANAQRTQGEWYFYDKHGPYRVTLCPPEDIAAEKLSERLLEPALYAVNSKEKLPDNSANCRFVTLAANLVPGLIARLRKAEEALRDLCEGAERQGGGFDALDELDRARAFLATIEGDGK